MTVEVHGQYKVRPNEVVNIASGDADPVVGFQIGASDDPAGTFFSNAGQVVANQHDRVVIGVLENTNDNPLRFVNGAGASFDMRAGAATLLSTDSDLEFTNRGEIEIESRSAGATTWGVQAAGLQTTVDNEGQLKVYGHYAYAIDVFNAGSLDNTGHIFAAAVDTAVGVRMWNEASFDNSGEIRAVAQRFAVAVDLMGGVEAFSNSGKIIATSRDGLASYGVLITPTDDGLFLTNTGLISASTAVYEEPEKSRADDTLNNAGTIEGSVNLGPGHDYIANTGLIEGTVFLDKGADTFVNTGRGRVDGVVEGGNGQDRLDGGKFADQFFGGSGLDEQDGVDTLFGRGGDDRLYGDAGDDSIIGGAGADILTGGDGADHFRYLALTDSRTGAMDHILDLQATDLIDVSAIDADRRLDGDQAFTVVAALDGHVGELALVYDAAADQTTLELDRNGDGKADMAVLIEGDARDFSNFKL